MTPTQARHLVIALSGLFQSAALVQHLARTGELDKDAMNCLIGSVFALDPPSVEDVYGPLRPLSLGMDVLMDILRGRDTARYADTLRYTLGLVQIERHLRNNHDLLATLRSRLEQVNAQRSPETPLDDPALIQRLAQLYLETAGTLRFRIQVKGDPRHLQGEATAHRVRACFLAGVRAAILWRQLGGSRLDFFLRKKTLINALEQLRRDAAIT